jgi:hypothetical protein
VGVTFGEVTSECIENGKGRGWKDDGLEVALAEEPQSIKTRE